MHERQPIKAPEKRSREGLLAGRVAIITGGADGIGRATAEAFLREGAKVAIFDNNKEQLRQTLRELSPHGTVLGYEVDVRDRSAIKAKLTDIEEKMGAVDTLVNNAGINPHAPLRDMTPGIWQDTLDINLTGAFNMTQIVGNRMIENGVRNGSIIFTTSIHTGQGFRDNGSYDASKHGMVALMRVAALEWADFGIRSNACAPGAIYPTGINSALTVQNRDELSRAIPLGRLGTPDEVANTIVFLASDLSSYITGEEIRVDGGVMPDSPLPKKLTFNPNVTKS